MFYAWFLAWMGRFDEAIAQDRRAQELDPLSPRISAHLGAVLFCARQYDGATAQYLRTIDANPNFARAYFDLGRVYIQTGRYDDAIAALRRGITLSGGGGASAISRAERGVAHAPADDRSAIDLKPLLVQHVGAKRMHPQVVVDAVTGAQVDGLAPVHQATVDPGRPLERRLPPQREVHVQPLRSGIGQGERAFVFRGVGQHLVTAEDALRLFEVEERVRPLRAELVCQLVPDVELHTLLSHPPRVGYRQHDGAVAVGKRRQQPGLDKPGVQLSIAALELP